MDTSKYDDCVLEMEKLLEGTMNYPPVAGEPQEESWNDKIFKEEYMDKFPVFERPTVVEFANAAKQFLNIYMTGEIQSVDYEKVLLILFAGMKIGTNYLGADNFHRSVGDESPKSLSIGEASIIKDLNPRFSRGVTQGRLHAAKTWYEALMYSLSEQIPDPSKSAKDRKTQQITERIESAANYVGLLALQTIRMVVKDQDQTTEHIIQRQNNHFSRFWRTNPIWGTPAPPHLDFQFRVDPFIKRFFPSSIRLLTYLLGSYLSDTVSGRLKEVLDASLMLPLNQVTLGCVKWVVEAARHLGCEPLIMLQQFSVLEHRTDDIEAIVDFYKKYVSNEEEKSWIWGRLFRDGAFVRSSCRRCPVVAVACAAIVHGNDPSHYIWKTSQFKEIAKKSIPFQRGLNMGMFVKNKFANHVTQAPTGQIGQS